MFLLFEYLLRKSRSTLLFNARSNIFPNIHNKNNTIDTIIIFIGLRIKSEISWTMNVNKKTIAAFEIKSVIK